MYWTWSSHQSRFIRCSRRSVREIPRIRVLNLKHIFFFFSKCRAGRNLSVVWSTVPCGNTGKIQYSLRNNSNAYWVSVLVQNTNIELSNVEMRPSGSSTVWNNMKMICEFFFFEQNFYYFYYYFCYSKISGLLEQEDGMTIDGLLVLLLNGQGLFLIK